MINEKITDRQIPGWLGAELSSSHPGIEIKWIEYGDRKTFVLPISGDAFYRQRNKRLNVVMYRRYITYTTSLRWKLHPATYIPDNDCAPSGRWVVFQTNRATDETIKLFDVVNDDGSLHPLDMRVIGAINLRDGKHGAHDKAILDVEAAPEDADKMAYESYADVAAEAFSRIYHDVRKYATDCVITKEDPNENDTTIIN